MDSNIKILIAIILQESTYLTIGLAVTLIPSFRLGIHPKVPQGIFLAWMPSINKECHQNHLLGVTELIGGRLKYLTPFMMTEYSIHIDAISMRYSILS